MGRRVAIAGHGSTRVCGTGAGTARVVALCKQVVSVRSRLAPYEKSPGNQGFSLSMQRPNRMWQVSLETIWRPLTRREQVTDRRTQKFVAPCSTSTTCFWRVSGSTSQGRTWCPGAASAHSSARNSRRNYVRPRATYAVEDRIRGSAGLVALIVGFVFQAVGYSVYLAERTKLSYGAKEALAGAVVALVPAVGIPLVEAAVRPRLRDRILVKVARFDWEGGDELRPRPAAHVLRSFGEQPGKPPEPNEDDGAYCQRVFGVEAEVLS
jgi:hypothetical protein